MVGGLYADRSVQRYAVQHPNEVVFVEASEPKPGMVMGIVGILWKHTIFAFVAEINPLDIRRPTLLLLPCQTHRLRRLFLHQNHQRQRTNKRRPHDRPPSLRNPLIRDPSRHIPRQESQRVKTVESERPCYR